VTLIAAGNRSLFIVPVAILVALIFVILAPSPTKLVTLIAAGNLALFIVPVNLDASRFSIPKPDLNKLKLAFIEFILNSKSVILDCGNSGICPSVNPVKLAPEPLNNVAETVPLTSSFVAGFLPIPKLLLGMSHIKFDV
jgi:hypothetical protein